MTVTPNMQTFVAVADGKVEHGSSMRSSVVSWCSSNWRKLASEVAATFLLIFLGCGTCIPIDGFDPTPPFYGALGFGFVVTIGVQTFGHISGAHMNPCITLLAVFWGKVSIVLGIFYLLSQIIGSIFGYWVLLNVSPVDFYASPVCLTLPHERIVEWQAVIIEVVLTMTLCLLTCAIWDPANETMQDSTSVKFGIAIAALSFAGGPLTGASMNPARSLGPALITGNWTSHWVYWVGPFSGAFISGAYRFIWLKKPKEIAQ